ncbi:hypothetical protein, partial [Megamonas funiformis]|uniref:hypothetical protein n=1 Tax=Megamonas funiformis TaxID=437897 RepID=UPI00265F8A3D
MHQEKIISQTDGILEEKTGLNELEFIETRRHWFDRTVKHYTNGSLTYSPCLKAGDSWIQTIL